MKQFLVPTLVVLSITSSAAAAIPKTIPAHVAAQRCSAFYVGPPPGGALCNALNWQPFLPKANHVACFPAEARELAGQWPGVARIVEPRAVRDVPSPAPPGEGKSGTPASAGRDEGGSPVGGAGLSPPPAPTDPGVCCLGSTCVETDAFDCRIAGGWFRGDVFDCSFNPCTTGVCCTGDPPQCIDEDLGGNPMDEELCNILNGDYLGGAQCDTTDPCQRFRIPPGFEIVTFSFGDEWHGRPRMNNCGELVFHYGGYWEDTTELYLYDNSVFAPITENDNPDSHPDINDGGVIAWVRDLDGFGRGTIVMSRNGDLSKLGDGAPPSINNLGHVSWDVIYGGAYFEAHIWWYDGSTIEAVFEDPLSNQSPQISDQDQITWTRYDFSDSPWTSQIKFYSGGQTGTLPTVFDYCQGPHVNSEPRVAWSCDVSLEMWESGETVVLVQGVNQGDNPRVNNHADIFFLRFFYDTGAWQTFVYRPGSVQEYYRLSDTTLWETDGDINDHAECAWHYSGNPNEGAQLPYGIRFMRRIRNGDVNFDGIVDINDFIPLPECWTGPVETDGLCECRFYDIDHDRDVDYDDFDLFMRVYAGPQEDCNANSIVDLEDLIEGTSRDCNLNGFPDECDITAGTSTDVDSDGVPDECCTPLVLTTDTLGSRNRYLTFVAPPVSEVLSPPPGFTYIRHAPELVAAVRVRFVDLPAPFDAYNGLTMWVGQPRRICENSGQSADVPPDDCGPAPGLPEETFTCAPLVCDPSQAHYADWSALGSVHLYHELIVPGGTYELQTILAGCGLGHEGNYSSGFSLSTALWGDLVSDCTTTPCGPPDGVVTVTDVVALMDKFQNLPGALTKSRSDVQPGEVDFIIDVSDVVRCISAFGGAAYPFSPPSPPCS